MDHDTQDAILAKIAGLELADLTVTRYTSIEGHEDGREVIARLHVAADGIDLGTEENDHLLADVETAAINLLAQATAAAEGIDLDTAEGTAVWEECEDVIVWSALDTHLEIGWPSPYWLTSDHGPITVSLDRVG